MKTGPKEAGLESEEALKKVVMFTLNGEQLPQLLMPIIRFVTPSRDHTVKKLLLLYWEVVEKTNADGKLKSEMILVWYVSLKAFLNYFLKLPETFVILYFLKSPDFSECPNNLL